MPEDKILDAFDAICDEAARLHGLTKDAEIQKGLQAIILMSRFQAILGKEKKPEGAIERGSPPPIGRVSQTGAALRGGISSSVSTR